MTVAPSAPLPSGNKTGFEARFDPSKILHHPDFKILDDDQVASFQRGDVNVNLACAYNEKHEVHMVRKPMEEPQAGEVKIRVRATGICG